MFKLLPAILEQGSLDQQTITLIFKRLSLKKEQW